MRRHPFAHHGADLLHCIARVLKVATSPQEGDTKPLPSTLWRVVSNFTACEDSGSSTGEQFWGVAAPRVRAAPYRFRGGPAERAQAVDCLATAALYEVGDDPRGQRAVIQVILNRVRAPGFPRTICGVVYQGFDRTTGCQFSFTCDGSIKRRTKHFGWSAARRVASEALAATSSPTLAAPRTIMPTGWCRIGVTQ